MQILSTTNYQNLAESTSTNHELTSIQADQKENVVCLKFIYLVILTLKYNAERDCVEQNMQTYCPKCRKYHPGAIFGFRIFSCTLVFLNKHEPFGNGIYEYFPSSDERVEKEPYSVGSDICSLPLDSPRD